MSEMLNRSTALMLRAGIVVSIVIMAIGLAVQMTGGDDTILYIGVLILIVSPFLGIIVSLCALLYERDYRWAAVAVVLLAITTGGILFAM